MPKRQYMFEIPNVTQAALCNATQKRIHQTTQIISLIPKKYLIFAKKELMRSNIFLLVQILLLFAACSAPKSAAVPAATPADPPLTKQLDNMLIDICGCTNSEGLTIEDYAERDRKNQGLNDADYMSAMEKTFTSPESVSSTWLISKFGHDTQFIDCAKVVAFQYKSLTDKDPSAVRTWLDQASRNYPVCAMGMHALLPLINNK